MTTDLLALIQLSEKATQGEWRYRCKSNSWHLAPDPYTAFQYGESIMDPEDEWQSLKFEDIEFVQALVNWFRATAPTLATQPAPGGGDGKVTVSAEALRYWAYSLRGIEVCCGHGQQVSENEIACCCQPVDAGEELGKMLQEALSTPITAQKE